MNGIKPSTFLLFMALTACSDDPPNKGTFKTDVPEREVTELFSYNGCRVYRFYDISHYHYYSDCSGSTERRWEEVCGHTGKDNSVPIYCDRSESIETSR